MRDIVREVDALRSFTPARLDLRRAGVFPSTAERLALAADHALARDAVRCSLDFPRLTHDLAEVGIQCIGVESAAATFTDHLLRPNLGRRLAAHSLLTLGARRNIAVVVADGLSAGAVQRYAPPLLGALGGVEVAVLVRHGRVAIGDEIGEAMDADLAVVLIGERPGLSAPESLGAYLTYAPRRGRTDAERVCLSNIRDDGTPPQVAAVRLRELIARAFAERRTGVPPELPVTATET